MILSRLPLNMVNRGETTYRSNRTAFFLVSLMLVGLLPMIATPVSAAESVEVYVSPSTQVVNPGDSGEYTITVSNTGDNPVTVNLNSAQEPGENCNGFNSVIIQIPGQIEPGQSEETTMNVTVAQTVEADTACETTVTATISAVIGVPNPDLPSESTTDSVVTTAGDGSGGLVSIDLYFDEDETLNQQTKTYDGSLDEIEYISQ